jgi:YbgC/YbaW family acyl-CoA thioester hydrolase
MAIEFEYKFKILENHLDSFGHVNNATYLQIYEEARWDFISGRGWGFEKIQNDKIGPVLLEAKLSFKRELLNREEITIKSIYAGRKNKLVMQMAQEMVKADGKIASTLLIDVGLIDMKARKLMEPTKEWMNAIGVVEEH